MKMGVKLVPGLSITEICIFHMVRLHLGQSLFYLFLITYNGMLALQKYVDASHSYMFNDIKECRDCFVKDMLGVLVDYLDIFTAILW